MHIRPFASGDRHAFAALNLAWIEEYFTVEESDLAQLLDPENSIIAKGGRIVVADIAGEVCGCGAIIPAHVQPEAGKFFAEIIKMAAKKEMRGKGIGRAVLDQLIEDARAMGADGIWMETSDKLIAANRLYRSAGFRALSHKDYWPTPYERCTAQFVMDF